MFYYSITWYIFCLFSGLGAFIYNFGGITLGNSKNIIRHTGGILFYSFIIISFLFHGWRGGVALIGVQLFMVVPLWVLLKERIYIYIKTF